MKLRFWPSLWAGCLVMLIGSMVAGCGVAEPVAQQETSSPGEVTQVATSSAVAILLPTSTSEATPTLSQSDREDYEYIAYFQTEVARPDINPTTQARYAAQIAMYEGYIARRATILASGPPSSLTEEARPTPRGTSTPFPRGLLPADSSYNQPGMPSQPIIVENTWSDGTYAQRVYAGAVDGLPGKGVLMVRDFMKTGMDEHWYYTPVDAGSIHILSETDYRLTLQAKDGTLFVFDLTTRTYDDTIIYPTPTVTPSGG